MDHNNVTVRLGDIECSGFVGGAVTFGMPPKLVDWWLLELLRDYSPCSFEADTSVFPARINATTLGTVVCLPLVATVDL